MALIKVVLITRKKNYARKNSQRIAKEDRQGWLVVTGSHVCEGVFHVGYEFSRGDDLDITALAE